MEAISTSPDRTYSQPPPGHLPDSCPNCNTYLGHYLALAPAPPQAAQEVTADDLFVPAGAPAAITPPPMPPLPELLAQTEKMQERTSPRAPAKAKAEKPAAVQIVPIVNSAAVELFDHAYIGGKLTLFVLLYGPDYKLHRRCLHSLAATTGLRNLVIRPICHELSTQSMQLLADLPLDHVYAGTKPRRKFESMRLAFHDPEHPIDTRWVVWIDDIAWCKRSDWLVSLAQTIISQDPGERVGAIGNKLCHVLPVSSNKDPRSWFRQAGWFKNNHLHTRSGAVAPNGDCVHYVSPNFFALSRDAIRECDIPDVRLKQSGGGITIGAQLHQSNYKIKGFNNNHTYVHAEQPARPRGKKEIYPWQI